MFQSYSNGQGGGFGGGGFGGGNFGAVASAVGTLAAELWRSQFRWRHERWWYEWWRLNGGGFGGGFTGGMSGHPVMFGMYNQN